MESTNHVARTTRKRIISNMEHNSFSQHQKDSILPKEIQQYSINAEIISTIVEDTNNTTKPSESSSSPDFHPHAPWFVPKSDTPPLPPCPPWYVPTWRALLQWIKPTSSEESAASEREVLERWGRMPVDDSKRVRFFTERLQEIPKDHVKTKNGEPMITSEERVAEQVTPPNNRYINSVVMDNQGLEDVSDPSISKKQRINVIFCHGFGAGIGFLYKNLWPLAESIKGGRIWAFDWLGMGRSGRPDFPKFQKYLLTKKSAVDSDEDSYFPFPKKNITPTPSTVTSAIDFFLDSFEEWRSRQRGLDKFVLIGHSMGGYLAALYAIRHPERVQKLILVSPVGLSEQSNPNIAVTGHKLPFFVSPIWNANVTPQSIIRSMGPFGPRFASGYVESRFRYLPPEERASLGRYLYHISADLGSGEYALAALLAPGAWAREPLHRHLTKLCSPTTFLYGSHDWMDRKHAETAAKLMQEQGIQTRVISVDRAGHHLNIDNAEEFNNIVIKEITEMCLNEQLTSD